MKVLYSSDIKSTQHHNLNETKINQSANQAIKNKSQAHRPIKKHENKQGGGAGGIGWQNPTNQAYEDIEHKS